MHETTHNRIKTPEKLFSPGGNGIEISNIELHKSIPLASFVKNTDRQTKKLIASYSQDKKNVLVTLRLDKESILAMAFPDKNPHELNTTEKEIGQNIFENIQINISDLICDYTDLIEKHSQGFSFKIIPKEDADFFDLSYPLKTHESCHYLECNWISTPLSLEHINNKDTSIATGSHLQVLILNKLADRVRTIAKTQLNKIADTESLTFPPRPINTEPLQAFLYDRKIVSLYGETTEGQPLYQKKEGRLTLRIPLLEEHHDDNIDSMPNTVAKDIISKLPGINLDIRLDNQFDKQYLYISVVTEGYRDYDIVKTISDTLGKMKKLFSNSPTSKTVT